MTAATTPPPSAPHAPAITAPAALDISHVRDLFAPGVRVMLDWDELVRHDAPVSLQVLTVDDLPALYTPWYVDPASGCEVPYDHTPDKPLLVREALRCWDLLHPDRTDAIRSFSQQPHATALTVPCFAASTSDLLLLDGNHRIVAAAAHHLPVRVLAVVIHGPVAPHILPDLRSWQAPTTTG